MVTVSENCTGDHFKKNCRISITRIHPNCWSYHWKVIWGTCQNSIFKTNVYQLHLMLRGNVKNLIILLAFAFCLQIVLNYWPYVSIPFCKSDMHGYSFLKDLGGVWLVSSNTHFHILNNITYFFTLFHSPTRISKNFK